MAERTGRLVREDGVELAWALQPGRDPTLVFLPGFTSDMTGEKATDLVRHCAAVGQAMLRFDYSGHGASGGRFEDGTISAWRRDALLVMDRFAKGKVILIGSSMGGWIALLVALARRERVVGLIGIAAAPDFTDALMWQAMTFEERDILMSDGLLMVASRYGDPYPVTRALIEDGRRNLLLQAPIEIDCPVRLLQGQQDPDVPWELALRLADRIAGPDVRVTLIKDGDHRLSRPADLALLRRTVAGLLEQDGA